MNLRTAICNFRLLVASTLLLGGMGSALAQFTNAASDEIPPLAPPLPEIPPSAWEQSNWMLWIVVPLFLLVVALLVWLLLRPGKPPVLLPAAAQARINLRNLQSLPESGPVLSQVSQSLRQYLVKSFWLPPHEMTTSEFCALMAESRRIKPALATQIGEFLQSCDQRKFSPAADTPPLGAATRGLELIELVEAWRVENQAAAQSTKPA